MAVVAGLVVSITARVDKFEKQMGRASRSIGRFASKVGKGLAIFTGVGAAIGGLLALAGSILSVVKLAGRISQAAQAIDALAKSADRIGVTTKALGGLRFAAQFAGIEAGALDKGMQRLTRRVSEAAKGGGKAAGALMELGLSAKRLQMLTPDKAFAEIADAMERVTNQGDRVRLAFSIFDSEGVAFVNLMRGGSAALRDAAAEAEKFGLAVTRIDAAKIEIANNAIKRLKALFQGLIQQIAIKLAPFVNAIVSKITDFGTSGTGAADAVTIAFGFVVNTIATLADLWDVVILKTAQWKVTAIDAAAAIVGFFERHGALAKPLGLVGLDEEGIKAAGKALFEMSRDAAHAVRNLEGYYDLVKQPTSGERFKAFIEGIQERFTAMAAERARLFGVRPGGAGAGGVDLAMAGGGVGAVTNPAFSPRFAAGFRGPLGTESPVQVQKRILTEQAKATALTERILGLINRAFPLVIGRF